MQQVVCRDRAIVSSGSPAPHAGRRRVGSAAGFLLFAALAIEPVAAETVVGGSITADTTWALADSPIILDDWDECHVGSETPGEQVTLTIEAGVEVRFRDTRELHIGSDAALVIAGSEASPVTFLLDDQGNYNTWELVFAVGCTADDCDIDYAVFDGGGYNEASGMVNINEGGAGTVTFRHCEFRNSLGRGLFVRVRDGGMAALVDNCEFHDNGNAHIEFNDRLSTDMAQTSTVSNSRFYNQADNRTAAIKCGSCFVNLADNTGDNHAFVELDFGNWDYEFPAITMQVPGLRDDGQVIPYVLDDLAYGSPEGQASTLTIAPGNVLKLTYEITIDRNAALHIAGTEEAPVLITHWELEDEDPPRWRAIAIEGDADAASCVVQHATFEYGGSGSFAYDSMLEFDNRRAANPLTIGHCTFRHSHNTGLFIDQAFGEQVSPVTIHDCTFHDNGDQDIWFRGHGTGDPPDSIVQDCRFYNSGGVTVPAVTIETCRVLFAGLTGDDNTFIRLDEQQDGYERDCRLSFPGTLDNGNPIPYYLNRDVCSIDAVDGGEPVTLTIDPGCVFHLQQQYTYMVTFDPAHFSIGTNAAISARGTAEQPIVFAAGDRWQFDGQVPWGGIEIDSDANGGECIFEHVTLEGGEELDTAAAEAFTATDCTFRNGPGGVNLGAGAAANLHNCRFENLDDDQAVGVGNSSGDPASLTISGCTFRNNAEGIRFRTPAEGTVVTNCTFDGNTDYGIVNEDAVSVDARNCDWADGSGPLDDSDSEDTNFELGAVYYNPEGQGDAVSDDVLYAPWVGMQRTVHLTIDVMECKVGGTWPTAGTHEVPMATPVEIVAVPVCDGTFDGWSVTSGLAAISAPESPKTTVTLSEDAVITAGFATGATALYTQTEVDEQVETARADMTADIALRIPDRQIATAQDALAAVEELTAGGIDRDGDGWTDQQERANETDPDVYSVDLRPGWNLISFARVPENNSVEDVFQGVQTGEIWVWNPDTGQYEAVETVTPLRGHWVYVTEAAHLHIALPNTVVVTRAR